MFNITLKVNNTNYRTKGKTALSALTKLDPPIFIKTSPILKLHHNKKTAEVMLNNMKLKRIFACRVATVIMAKKLTALLK